MNTDHMQQEHQRILSIVHRMEGRLSGPATAIDGDALRKDLIELSGAVTVHLAGEDRHLYPLLLKAEDTKVAETAKRFAYEMGAIGEAFRAYLKNYPNGAVIHANAAKFVEETRNIFGALGKRIQREEKELYPLAAHTH